MHHEATHYDRDCFQRLLEDTLPESLAGEVIEHVADCSACRQQLEGLAGNPDWWLQASSGVKSILANPAAYQSHVGGMPFVMGANHSETSDESFVTDFAVDFLEPSNDTTMLGKLGEYEIVEVIGRGGMGIVLKGFQKELHRHVAVKVLAPHLATSGAARRRFAREAQATAAIVHPHVMAIHSVNANVKLPYLVMPFVPCESLQQRLDRQGPLDVIDVLRIGMQAANGLAAAHAQGLVHRDVKPANILLEDNVDRVLLTDFGLARAVDDATLTRTGIIAGTPQYMSPEQANGDAVDHRSDLFSLGSVLYAMCTGRPPFRADTTFGVLRRIRETPPRSIREINSEIPDWLERIVLKLLSKDASDRVNSATEVASVLEKCLAHVQQPTTIPLPKIVAGWVRPPGESDEQTTGQVRLSQRIAQLMPPRLFLVAIIFTVIIMASIWNTWRPASLDSESNSPISAETRTTDPLFEWNAIQNELDTTFTQIERLETTVQGDLKNVDPTPTQPSDPDAIDEQ